MLRDQVTPYSSMKGDYCPTDAYSTEKAYPGDESRDNYARWCTMGVKNCRNKFCELHGKACKNECAAPAVAKKAVGRIDEGGVEAMAVGREEAGIDKGLAAKLCYGNMHSDLKEKICKGGCVTEAHAEQLMQHFKDHGMKENRVFCTPEITKEARGELTRANTEGVSVVADTAPAIKEGYRVEPFQRRYKRGAIRGMQI